MVNFLHLKTEVHFSTSWNSLTRKSSRRFPTCLVKLAPIPYRVSQSKMNIFRRLIDNFEKNMYLGQAKSHSYFQILFIYIHKCQEAVHKLCRLKINKFWTRTLVVFLDIISWVCAVNHLCGYPPPPLTKTT